MSILLIIYFVSMAVAGLACFLALKSQWEEGVDIDLQDIMAATAITVTPVLNTFMVLSGVVELIVQCPAVIKGKKQ